MKKKNRLYKWMTSLLICTFLLGNCVMTVSAETGEIGETGEALETVIEESADSSAGTAGFSSDVLKGQQTDGLCGHHTEHTPECGYSESTPCAYVCEICRVQKLVDALPAPEEMLEMNEEASKAVRDQVLIADEAYQALDNGSRAQISGTENMTALLELFKGLNSVNTLNTVTTDGYDQTVVVGPDGFADIQSALDSLPAGSGDVLLRVDTDVVPSRETAYYVPTDKGITSLTIGTSGSVVIGRSGDRFFANGIPLTVDSGVTFHSSSYIFGGGDESSAFVGAGSSITINAGASVGYIYGGGRNRDLKGKVSIKLYGSAASVHGGGYAWTAAQNPVDNTVTANINGSVSIEVDGDASVIGTYDLYGGGYAYCTSASGANVHADVTGDISIYSNCPTTKGDIYGGGYAFMPSLAEGACITADVGGAVSITIGGDMQSLNPTSSFDKTNVFGGGFAQALEDAGDYTVSAKVAGGVTIDASRDNHATSPHDDWDGSMFMWFHCGGYAWGHAADATVSSTHIVTSRKVLDSEKGLFGGGYARAGGVARVTGDTYVKVQRAESQHATHDNAKSVYGGGRGEFGDATVEGNTTVYIDQNITFEPTNASLKEGPYGGGMAYGDSGVARVGGTATVIINGTNIAAVPGGQAVSGALAENCGVKAAAVQYIGNVNLSLRSGGPVASPVQIVIGDGTAKTEVKANYIYCPDGPDSKVAVSVKEGAALVQNAYAEQLLFNVTDLNIARGGSVTVNSTKAGDEMINGTLSGEGEMTLPAIRGLQVSSGGSLSGNLTINMVAGKVLTIYGGLTGNTTINLSGNAQPGTLVAWTQPDQDGSFTYTGDGLSLVSGRTTSWLKWTLEAEKTVTASVNGSGGSVSPETQQVIAGSGAEIFLKPDLGYKISSVTAAGVDRTADVQDGVLKLENIQDDTNVSVSFERMKATDVEAVIDALPSLDPEQPEAVETVLDVKMEYEALPDNEKNNVSEDNHNKLNAALEKLPVVEVGFSGNVTLENPGILLDTMTGKEAAMLKAGDYAKYKVELFVADSQPDSGGEQSSIQSALNGATPAVHHEVLVRKVITPVDNPDNPQEELITQLPRPIRLVFTIPAELRAAPDNLIRSFIMLRTHLENGVYTTTALEDEDTDPETYTVTSNQFSLYTLAYTDEVSAYKLTAGAGEGGTISPDGIVKAAKNASQTFTITADTGYHIKDVLVDGKSVGNVGTYTFSNIAADHTISAVFEKNTAKPTVKPENTPGNVSGNNTPQTGDRISGWIFVMILSGGLAAAMMIYRRRVKVKTK